MQKSVAAFGVLNNWRVEISGEGLESFLNINNQVGVWNKWGTGK